MFPLVEALSPIISKVLDLIPDPNARAKAENEMQASLIKYAADQAAQQAAINTAEAQSSSVWVAGWRPAIGWACASAFTFMYVLGPIVVWVAAMFNRTVPLPQFDSNSDRKSTRLNSSHT